MGESWGEWFGRHFVAPFTMFGDAGVLSVLLVIIWLLYPFALQTVIIRPTPSAFRNGCRGCRYRGISPSRQNCGA